MHKPTVFLFLAFNTVAGVLALTPDLGLSEQVATTLHVAVAAFNMAVLRRCSPAILGPVIVLAAAMMAVEGLQTMIPGRSGSFEDIAADLFGLAIGLAVASIGPASRPRRHRDAAAPPRTPPVVWEPRSRPA